MLHSCLVLFYVHSCKPNLSKENSLSLTADYQDTWECFISTLKLSSHGHATIGNFTKSQKFFNNESDLLLTSLLPPRPSSESAPSSLNQLGSAPTAKCPDYWGISVFPHWSAFPFTKSWEIQKLVFKEGYKTKYPSSFSIITSAKMSLYLSGKDSDIYY